MLYIESWHFKTCIDDDHDFSRYLKKIVENKLDL